MKRDAAYYFTGKLLSENLSEINRQEIIRIISSREFPWEHWIGFSDHHLIMQSLYPKIRDKRLLDFFPTEITDHLKHIFELTTSRNQEILKQSASIASLLSSAGIKPLFMKGVGNIIEGIYRYPGERILHDIDILVDENLLEKAADILIANGYRSDIEYTTGYRKNNRHFPILYKKGEAVYLELHWTPTGTSYSKHFNTEIILRDSECPTGIKDCLVMSNEHKIIHNFIHAQFDHKAKIYGREYLRNLYDLLMLSRISDPEKVFFDFGYYRRASSGYLDIFYDAFGITPKKRIKPFFFMHSYRLRYRLNLRSRVIAITSFFLVRVYLGYIVTPIKGITNKELRGKMFKKLQNPQWYKKQFSYYKRVFGIGITGSKKLEK